MSLPALQQRLARLLTDAQYRAEALAGGEVPPELCGVDTRRVEAFARTLAGKRRRALRRALPVSMGVLAERASDLLDEYCEVQPPRAGPGATDAERFAAFASRCSGVAGLPAWLPDLLRYEAACHAVRRAPPPQRRKGPPAPLSADACLVPAPALRVLALDWNVPALLPEIRSGARPVARPERVYWLMGRSSVRGDLRQQALNLATWMLLSHCDGARSVEDAVGAAGRAVPIPPDQMPAFRAECLKMLALLVQGGLLLLPAA